MKVLEPIDDRDVLAGAALERLAVDLAVKEIVTRSPVSALAPSPLRQERPVLLGDALHRLVDLGSVTSATSRSSLMSLKSASSICGRISIATV